MANELVPWALTVGQLRDEIRDVADDVAVALVYPPSVTEALGAVRSVVVSYEAGPLLRLTPLLPPAVREGNRSPSEPPRSPQPSDGFVNAFAFAVARAGCFELKARLLADKTASLRKRCISEKLDTLVARMADEYAHILAPDEFDLLRALPGIRNKLLHLELSRATGRIKPLTDSLREAGVTMLDLETGDVVSVANSATEDGRIFGWVLEGAASGAFEIAADKFLEGVVLLERLMDECDRRTPQEGS